MLSFYRALQLPSLYSIISQTYRFPAHVQNTSNITKDFHSHKGFCLNPLAIAHLLFRLAMQDTVARAQLNLLNSKVKTLSNTQIPARLEHQGLKSSQSTLIASHMGMSPHHMTS